MKRKSSRFLALLLTAVLAVTPVSSVSAQGAGQTAEQRAETGVSVTTAVETSLDSLGAEETAPAASESSPTEPGSSPTEPGTSPTEPSPTEPGISPGSPGTETGTEQTETGETETASPGTEEESTEEASTESPVEEVPEEDTEQGDGNGSVSGNQPEDEGTVSGNTVSGNAVSGNTISDSETSPLFPGMAESYRFSSGEMSQKADLYAHLPDILQLRDGVDYAQGEVVLRAENRETAEAFAAAYGGTLTSYMQEIAVIQLANGVRVSQALDAASDAEMPLPVVWPNYYRRTTSFSEEGGDTALAVENFAAATYSDPYIKPGDARYQWQHNAVGSVLAWNAGYTGKGVKVAILDSGISSHEDLKFAGTFNATTDSSITDVVKSGTHAAGIIGAKSGNNKGGAGIAPEADLYGIKTVNDKGVGKDSNILAGIQYAIETWKVDIIDISPVGVGYNGLYQEIMDAAMENGTLIFTAASDNAAGSKSYLADYENVICVAAVNQSGAKASFSNYGSWVDLCGPGVDIVSTVPSSVPPYVSMSGTAQAAAVTAGCAAVILSAHLPAIEKANGPGKVKALKTVLTSNVTKGTGSGIGKGMVNLPKALKIATSIAAPDKPVFDKTDKSYTTDSVLVKISAAPGMDIYYAKDGKTPTIKEGNVKNAVLYTAPVLLENASKITLKAIAVNAWGKASPVTSFTYNLNPAVRNIAVTGPAKLVAGKSASFQAQALPTNAALKKVSWSITPADANTKISSAGKVTTKVKSIPGVYEVRATAENGVMGTYSFTISETATVSKINFKEKTVKLNRGGMDDSYDLGTNLNVILAATGQSGSVNDVTFSSSHPNVGIISSGYWLILKGGGSTVITVAASDGSGIKSTFKVQVTQFMDSLGIVGNETLAKGTSSTMKVNVFPASTKSKAVIWSISPADGGVSISSGGKVKVEKGAQERGYTITATAKDPIDDVHTVTATKKIMVTNGAVKKIEMDAKAITLLRTPVYGSQLESKTVNVKLTGEGVTSGSYELLPPSNENVVKATRYGDIIKIQASGKATGTATITVQSIDGTNKKAVCKVTVINPPSHVMVSPEAGRTATISNGKTLKLNATLETENGPLANKKVKWESSNPEVAAVKAGKVTALANGTATIKAIAEAGGASGTYTIKVMNPVKTLELKGFNKEGTTSFTSGKTYGNVLLYNDAAYESPTTGLKALTAHEVSVDVGNGEIIGVENGQRILQSGKYYYGINLTFHKPGKTTITVKAMDGSGVTVKYKVEIT